MTPVETKAEQEPQRPATCPVLLGPKVELKPPGEV